MGCDVGRFIRSVGKRCFRFYVALNILVLAVLTGGACHPRETVSGWLGRTGRLPLLRRAVDAAHWWQDDHCGHTARCEAKAWRELEYD